MFNNHEDIIGIMEDGIEDIFHYGMSYQVNEADYGKYIEDKNKLCEVVKQRLEYMQSQIDELQLEYCPEEMSKKQLDNWAKNQKPLSEIRCKEIDKLLNPRISYGRHIVSNAKDDIEEFVDTNHNELWIDGIKFELSK